MSALRRLSGALARTLHLGSKQAASLQQGAAFHLSATLEARRKRPAGSDSDSDDEGAAGNPRGGAKLSSHSSADDDEEEARGGSGEAMSYEEQLYDMAQRDVAAGWDMQTVISPALAAALEAASDEPGADEQALMAFGEALEQLETGALSEEQLEAKLRELGDRGDDPEGYGDLRVLADAIDLYMQVAPEADEEADGLPEFDRDLLQALGDSIRELALDPSRSRTINMAPPGRLPWEMLDVNEELPMVNWGVDLTEGRAADPWKNALLSEEAKELMHRMHGEGVDVPTLAAHFKVREQRVMAILALKEREHAARAAGEPLCDELAAAMEEVHGAHEVVGAGERHHVVLPSFPNYAQLGEADAERLAAVLEARLGKPFDEIEPEDMTEEVTRELLAAAGADQGAVEEQLAETEEQHLVAEFARNLAYNTGKSGKSLSRSSRKRHPPKRPEGGWGLLVKPLGRAAHSGDAQPFVALPDGGRRELTEDEKVHLERQQPRPRSKIL